MSPLRRKDDIPAREDEQEVSRAIDAVRHAHDFDELKKLTASAQKVEWRVLARFAGGNAHRQKSFQRQLRLMMVGLGLFLAGIGWVVYHNGNAHHAETLKIAQSTVISRYDAAFLSCLQTNYSNAQGKRIAKATLKDPTSSNVNKLIDALRPLRSSTAPPPPVLPALNRLPHGWIVGCQRYATSTIAVQPVVKTPKPLPIVTTATNTTATKH